MQDRAPQPPAPDDLPSRVEAAWPSRGWRDTHVGVAVSGGADSVAMLRVLADLKRRAGGRGRLTVLHFDHGVRPGSSADADWVGGLAASLGLDCVSDRASGLQSTSEESLRDARRTFYRAATDSVGARYLATGHTADDQAETVLFRALRGSGVRGLAGIRGFAPLTASCVLSRPLLTVSRVDLLAYLTAIGQAFRQDESNQSDAYTRNWIRNRVLPLLRERIPEVDSRLVGLSRQAEDACSLVERAAADLLEAARVGPITIDGLRLDRTKLAGEPVALVCEVIRAAWRQAGWPEQAMTAVWWRRLAEMAVAEGPLSSESLPGGVNLTGTADTLLLAPGG